MPYIGNTIRAADDYRLIDDISSGFNGSETSFALQVAGSAPVPFPKSPQQVLISVNGVIQEPDPTGSSGFNLVGTNIVFSSAPTNGHAFFGIIYATADYLNAGGNFPAGSLGAPSITFIGDENTGLFRKSGGSVGFVSDATEIANFDSNGITISSGNIIIPDSIIHGGDSDTKIRFSAADTVTIETGGTQRLFLGNADTVFNETGADVNLRIESDGNANCFTLDAGKSGIGINQEPATGYGLDILGNSGYDDVIRITGVGTNIGPRFNLTPTGTGVGRINATANSLQLQTGGTTAITIDTSQKVGIGTSSPSTPLHVSTITDGTSDLLTLHADADGQNANNGIASIKFMGNSNHAAFIKGGHTANGDTILTFHTDAHASGINPEERMRIDSSGRLLLGTTSVGAHEGGNNFTIAESGHCGMTIRSSTSTSGNIYFADGTSSGESARGEISYRHATDDLRIFTAATERMRIDSSGNLVVGGTSAQASDAATLMADGEVTAAGFYFSNNIGSAMNNTGIRRATTNTMVFDTDSTERMRIDSSGRVGIGTTSPNENLTIINSANHSTSPCYIKANGSNNVRVLGLQSLRAATSGGIAGSFIEFFKANGSAIGSVTGENSISYNTTSDYRLKENVVAISDGITRLKTLKPSRFNWIVNPSTTVDGFLAHEVTAVPEAISGTKDEVDSDNNPVYQMMDNSKLVPLLTAALQEAVAEIETLKTKVAALEAA